MGKETDVTKAQVGVEIVTSLENPKPLKGFPAGKRVHLTVGHGGNYKDYVANVREICDMVQIRKRAAG